MHLLQSLRSGRVIAASRFGMAAMFAAWVWIDPDQPARHAELAYGLMAGYLAFCLILIPVAWTDWWLDFRLARPALVVDSLAFPAAVFFTATADASFASPFLAYFALVLPSVTIRFGHRIAAVVAAMLCASYLLVAGWHISADADGALFLVVRRVSYMAIVSVLLIWFVSQQGERAVPRFAVQPSDMAQSPLALALAYAMDITGARGGAIAWSGTDEEHAAVLRAGSLGSGPQSPQAFAFEGRSGAAPMLFDLRHDRSIRLERGRLIDRHGPVEAALPVIAGAEHGILIPISGRSGRGQMVLCDIDGLSTDHLMLGGAIARELARGLDEDELANLAREAAVARARSDIARDLHDSVAQSLAGTTFRLEALRDLPGIDDNARGIVSNMIDGIRHEQEHVRSIIANLRQDGAPPGWRDPCAALIGLGAALGKQWGVEVVCTRTREQMMLPARLVLELQQIAREAVANAVRHGGARRIELALERRPGAIMLVASDDGSGFSRACSVSPPRSIAERTSSLDGTLSVVSHPGETRVEVILPTGESR